LERLAKQGLEVELGTHVPMGIAIFKMRSGDFIAAP
jgi:hypothetical protein